MEAAFTAATGCAICPRELVAESASSVKEVRVFVATKYSDILVMLSIRAVLRSMPVGATSDGKR